MEYKVNTKKLQDEFGTAIRRRRHKLNLSQEDFADKADIHRTYVSAIELGKVDVGISVALKIATALGCPLSHLIRETENKIKS